MSYLNFPLPFVLLISSESGKINQEKKEEFPNNKKVSEVWIFFLIQLLNGNNNKQTTTKQKKKGGTIWNPWHWQELRVKIEKPAWSVKYPSHKLSSHKRFYSLYSSRTDHTPAAKARGAIFQAQVKFLYWFSGDNGAWKLVTEYIFEKEEKQLHTHSDINLVNLIQDIYQNIRW